MLVSRIALIAMAGAFMAACSSPTDTSTKPVDDTPGSIAWHSVGVNSYNACALTADGRVFCAGFREPVECGAASCAVDAVPTPLNTSLRFDQLVLGEYKRCAISTTKQLFCWGSSFFGTTLGDGVTEKSGTPVAIPIPGEARSIAAGYEQSCAIVLDGTAYCWGGGQYQLGDGADSLGYRRIKTPAPVATSLTFTSVSAGTTQTCAIATDASAYCWGSGYGTLGIGARDTACTISSSCYRASTPELVTGGHAWKAISAGNTFTCGITTDDRTYCWGAVRHFGDPNPALGLLGNGTFEGSKEPVPVSSGLFFQSITTGTRHACALTLEGDAWCWGNNESSELGRGQRGGRFNTPQKVAGGLRFTAIEAGNATCAVSVNKNLYCWGQRLDQLGVISVPTRMEP